MTADNGRRVGPSSLRTCKRCGCQGLAWTQNTAGRWYLCGTFRSQSERELYVMATWSPHRCEDYRDHMAEVRARWEQAEREQTDRRALAVAAIAKLRAALESETDAEVRERIEFWIADFERDLAA